MLWVKSNEISRGCIETNKAAPWNHDSRQFKIRIKVWKSLSKEQSHVLTCSSFHLHNGIKGHECNDDAPLPSFLSMTWKKNQAVVCGYHVCCIPSISL
jgi:hypothetical protein